MAVPSAPIYFDPRWVGQHGIGRFASEVTARLPAAVPLQIIGRKLGPCDPLAISLALAGKQTGIYFSPGFNPPLCSRIPFTFTIHDLIHLHVADESSAVRRMFYRHVVLPATQRAHTVFTVSEFTKNQIIEWSGVAAEQIQVVGNGLSSAFAPAGPRHSPGCPYFLHVGRRVAHKNIFRLLEAFRASRAGHEAHLLFTGYEDRATVNHVKQLGLEEKVRFTGPLSDEALAAVYRGAVALLFPSLYEGFGLPIIEAMACGTPVLTSNITAMPEVAGHDAALQVDPYQVESIRDSLNKLVDDEELRRRLRENGLIRSADFNWSRTAHSVARRLAVTHADSNKD